MPIELNRINDPHVLLKTVRLAAQKVTLALHNDDPGLQKEEMQTILAECKQFIEQAGRLLGPEAKNLFRSVDFPVALLGKEPRISRHLFVEHVLTTLKQLVWFLENKLTKPTICETKAPQAFWLKAAAGFDQQRGRAGQVNEGKVA